MCDYELVKAQIKKKEELERLINNVQEKQRETWFLNPLNDLKDFIDKNMTWK